MSDFFIVLPIVTGIIGGVVVAYLSGAGKRLRNIITLLTTVITALLTWKLLPGVLHNPASQVALGGNINPDPLGMVFALISSSLWVFATIYSFGYMADKPRQRTYFTFFLISAGVTLGIALAGNLLVLYIFYELLTFTTYPLVIYQGDQEALKAGNRYIIYSLVGAGFILAGLIATWIWTGGNLSFGAMPLLAEVGTKPGMGWIFFLFLIGFGVKAAVMPLHGWLPRAMVAPTPISALLHAVAVVNAGVFGLLRVIYSVFGYNLLQELGVIPVTLIIVSFTIITASLIAMRQDVLKKRLAYSTISQLSYILLGALTLNPLGLAGAIIQMINHAILKIALFFSVGVVAEETGKIRVSQVKGLGTSLPLVFISFGVASIGMVGMLPLNGFWSKYYLLRASTLGGYWPLVVILLVSGLLNAFYYLPIIVSAFTKSTNAEPEHKLGRNGLLMLVPTIILVAAALALGFWPNLSMTLVDSVVEYFF